MAGSTALSARDRESLSAAAAHFSAGRHVQAIEIATELCRRHPLLGLAHKLLGSALHVQGRAAEAVTALSEAVRLLPEDGQSWSNLGNALAAAGRDDEAVRAHVRAIALQPGVATPHYNLGCVLLQAQRRSEALAQFRQAYECAPGDRALARLCRELLIELGERGEAQRFCRLNLAHLPDDADALAMLGSLLLDAENGDRAEAEGLLRAALEHAPDNAVAWSNLCVVLRERACLTAAIEAGQRALALNPGWAPAHNNLGVAQRDAGAWNEARSAFLRALECDPDHADAYYNLGCVCADLGEHELAREALIEAVKRQQRPSWLLQAAHACRQLADWEGADLLEHELDARMADPDSLAGHDRPSPFAYLTTPGSDAKGQLRIARHFSRAYPGGAAPVCTAGRRDALRVGLLSSDFRDHATAHLLVGVLEALDPERFELVAYDYGPQAHDAYRTRLEQVIGEWVAVGELSDHDAAQRMREDRIDIAIDLKGWTQGYRCGILAHRPAPLQMQWLGFPGTMGAAWIDYLIADAVVIPPGAEDGYSEKILRLPGCYQPNDRLREVGPTPSRAMLGLPEHGLVMAAFHQTYKITRETFDLWLRLLARIPDAVLWLLEAPPMARAAMLDAAAAQGIDSDRLVWAPRVAARDHLGRLAAADLALDAYPVNAHTTASDAMWAGVPQVARCGDTFVSRVSASVVSAAGLPELVARSDVEYEALILDLAADRVGLSALRLRLLGQREYCALFDTAAFARDLGRGLNMAWERQVAGLEPDHLAVSR